MKKKFLVMLSITAMLLLCLTGCGDNGDTNKQGDSKDANVQTGGTVIIYSPLTQSMIDSMCAKFEEDTGIHAECLEIGRASCRERV